jgi:Inner membrane protein YgaP-like, transmembrane domain
MKTNMSAIDRAIRLLLVAVIALFYFTDNISGALAIILGVLAIVFVFTSFSGFCPLYYSFKISSIRKSVKI